MRLNPLVPLVALVMFAAATVAAPPTYYRISPLPQPPGDPAQITGRNERGVIIGYQFSETDFIQRGFALSEGGDYQVLNDLISSGSTYVEPLGINSRSEISGVFTDPTS